MLGTKTAVATVAVRDIEAAKKFYEDLIGLELDDVQGPGAIAYKTGSSKLVVYPSQFAGTNMATAVTWFVGSDLEELVRGLAARGVKIEHYDLPNIRRDGDIHLAGNMKMAWFKDPDGNIHSLINK